METFGPVVSKSFYFVSDEGFFSRFCLLFLYPPLLLSRQVEPITFRVASGKCVLVGGLARIEVVGDTKPFLFTFFVSNEIKLHPTDVTKADDFVANHAGEMLTPPLAPGPRAS